MQRAVRQIAAVLLVLRQAVWPACGWSVTSPASWYYGRQLDGGVGGRGSHDAAGAPTGGVVRLDGSGVSTERCAAKTTGLEGLGIKDPAPG